MSILSRLRRQPILAIAGVALLAGSAAHAQVSTADRARFSEQHNAILRQFGGSYSGPGAALVGRVGRTIAVQSGLSRDGSDCTVTLLDSEIVNAFAAPGCYVYVTRGLMALMNDEAELASVLGHEIGHVAARHAQKREGRSVLAGLGAAAAALLTGSDAAGGFVGQLGQLGVLSYSRGQEYEADALGVRYMVKAGYDPYASADMLRALSAEEAIRQRLGGAEGADRTPAWARTHPLTGDRVTRARALAGESGVARGSGRREGPAYLAAIEGMTYGDDPAQGIVNGQDFIHPALRIAFRAPPGFVLQNSPTAVIARGPAGEVAQFGGGALQPGESLASYATRIAAAVTRGASTEAGPVRDTTINGVPAAILPLRARSNRGPVDVSIAAYGSGGGSAYHFIAMGPSGTGDGTLRSLQYSFRRISASEADAARPRVISLYIVRQGDTVEDVGRQMAFDDLPVDRFRALNDLEAGARLTPGQRVKIVRFAR